MKKPGKLRICMLIARFHPISGGTEIQARRLALRLLFLCEEVFIVTARINGLPKFEDTDGLKVYRTAAFGSGIISSFVFFISSFIFLLRRRKTYDIIHVHLVSGHALSAILLKLFFGKKILVKFGGARSTGDIGTSLSRPLGRLKLFIVRRFFNAFAAPSREVYDEIISFGFNKNKISIIPNGVDTDLFRPVSCPEKSSIRKVLNLEEKDFVCVYTGRIEMGKGIELALRAWEKMPDNSVLLIVGTGSLLKKFERDFIRKNIIFAGFKKNIQDYLAAADVFLFPSLGEGLSNSLIEAASCGLPVLANDMPSNSEIITSGRDGVLIDMRDPQKIISEIEKLRDDQELRYIFSREARNTAVKKFSIQTVAELYVDFYSRILAV